MAGLQARCQALLGEARRPVDRRLKGRRLVASCLAVDEERLSRFVVEPPALRFLVQHRCFDRRGELIPRSAAAWDRLCGS